MLATGSAAQKEKCRFPQMSICSVLKADWRSRQGPLDREGKTAEIAAPWRNGSLGCVRRHLSGPSMESRNRHGHTASCVANFLLKLGLAGQHVLRETAATCLLVEASSWTHHFGSALREVTASSSCGRTANARSAEDGVWAPTAIASCWLCCPPPNTRHPPASIASPTNSS